MLQEKSINEIDVEKQFSIGKIKKFIFFKL